MLRALHIAQTGLEAQQTQLDTISNNLANVGTTGFKRNRAVFEDLMYQTTRQPGAPTQGNAQTPTGLQVGTGVKSVATVRNHAQGGLEQTENQFDVAINGNGFLVLEKPEGGNIYTRDGSLQLNSEGTLVSTNGLPVLGPIQVPADAESVSISPEGRVTAQIVGQIEPQELGQIQLATFINPTGLDAKGGNLLQESVASGAPTLTNPNENGAGVLMQGFVESSNVNVVEELVGLISTQRSYEMNSKAITTADQMLSRLSQI